MSVELLFTHEAMNKPLVIQVKPDQIKWSYGLNTKSYPTFGGEVVQILSMYIGDLQIGGSITTYKQMEDIYSWFIQYMQIATQGSGKSSSRKYDTRPVKMLYVERNWNFDIFPRELPNFRYGKDVVAPTWELTAAISEYDDSFQEAVISDQMFAGEAAADGFETFGTATGEIGYEENNPWSAPNTNKTLRDEQNKKLEDHLVNLMPSYLDGTFKDLESHYSQPHISKAGGNKANKPEAGKKIDPPSSTAPPTGPPIPGPAL